MSGSATPKSSLAAAEGLESTARVLLGPWVPVGPGPGKDNDRGRAITDFLVLRSAQPRSTLREQRALKQR